MMVFGFPTFSTTPPYTECPAIAEDTSCEILIVINAGGTLSIYADPSQGPYEGADDTLLGVANNSSSRVGSLNLTSTTLPIFGFDGDGICTYAPFTGSGYCASLPGTATGYEGPTTSFTNISGDEMSGTVVFAGGLAPGASAYFSLEDPLTATSFTGTTGAGSAGSPAPTTILLVVTGCSARSFSTRCGIPNPALRSSLEKGSGVPVATWGRSRVATGTAVLRSRPRRSSRPKRPNPSPR